MLRGECKIRVTRYPLFSKIFLVSRLPKTADGGPPVPDDYLHRVVDAIDAVAQETGKTVAQIAHWLLRKPTVSTLVIGARNEEQLMQNIGAEGWRLTGPLSGSFLAGRRACQLNYTPANLGHHSTRKCSD